MHITVLSFSDSVRISWVHRRRAQPILSEVEQATSLLSAIPCVWLSGSLLMSRQTLKYCERICQSRVLGSACCW